MRNDTMRNFDHLSDEERAVVGDPSDYDWDGATRLPAAPRPTGKAQFSMRVDPKLYAQIYDLALARGVNFSDLVREALTAFVARGSTESGAMVSIGDQARVVLTAKTFSLESRTKGPDAVRAEIYRDPVQA